MNTYAMHHVVRLGGMKALPARALQGMNPSSSRSFFTLWDTTDKLPKQVKVHRPNVLPEQALCSPLGLASSNEDDKLGQAMLRQQVELLNYQSKELRNFQLQLQEYTDVQRERNDIRSDFTATFLFACGLSVTAYFALNKDSNN